MREYKKRKVEKVEKVLTRMFCDQCGNDIQQTPHEHFYLVETSHNGWGNDSLESNRDYDLCDIKCVTQHMHDYYNRDDVDWSDRYEIVLEEKSEIWR